MLQILHDRPAGPMNARTSSYKTSATLVQSPCAKSSDSQRSSRLDVGMLRLQREHPPSSMPKASEVLDEVLDVVWVRKRACNLA